MAFIKALFPGFILTWLVAGVLGSQGVRGGILQLHEATIDTHPFFWSWPLFLLGTGLAWAMFALTSER
ncbi:hypothetical protein MTR62_03070 [Novosphingobium sp. 1949]|uniref:Uncharacterized protein n=1 Tax=Novosphingobium organovorum TaxID=2930092 RepID=A0ABT0B9J2_9SPHN|nr:hypothetical protein [Novosphingobium organovorum]MCJ2181693.1 hypothetical protein [Novosphingobium organovorum]